jgi:hypothetical protein
MDTPNEYSVGIRLIRQYHPDNIGWTVRLPMDTPNEYSVGIRLIRQYHPDNIGWAVS